MIERLFEVVDLERNTFKLIHSELIQQVQCVEFNLKSIYAAMCQGDFDDNFHSLDNANLGKIVRELKRLDHSDGCPELTDMNYKTIDEIRMIRNYWCHQCYLDFAYIQNDSERERAFQRIAERLHYDEFRTYELMQKTQAIYTYIMDKYRR